MGVFLREQIQWLFHFSHNWMCSQFQANFALKLCQQIAFRAKSCTLSILSDNLIKFDWK